MQDIEQAARSEARYSVANDCFRPIADIGSLREKCGMDHLTRDRYIQPGTKVRLDSGQPDGPEYGVVIHCWHDDEIGAWDCYVGFFGSSFPDTRPDEKPYVLRYAATSLDIISE